MIGGLKMVAGPKVDLQDISDSSQELEDENIKVIQRLELQCRIEKQKNIELQKQMAQKSEIDALCRSRDEKAHSSLQNENQDLKRQLEELQNKKEKEHANEMEPDDEFEERCNREVCGHIHCEACTRRMDTQDEMLEHSEVCHCNPKSPLYGKDF